MGWVLMNGRQISSPSSSTKRPRNLEGLSEDLPETNPQGTLVVKLRPVQQCLPSCLPFTASVPFVLTVVSLERHSLVKSY